MVTYRPEIDGLRAIAVVAVILFHLDAGFLAGGYYGVDVFFVISGYLITGILVKDLQQGNFRLLAFWLRRIKRIVPLLLTVVIAALLVLPLFIFLPTFKETLDDVFPVLFSYFNFHAYHNFGDYWRHKAEHSFFLHAWSLSVEEQFYILFPVLLFAINKYFKSFLIPLLLIAFLSLGLFWYFVNKETQLSFYMLPFRIWELSAGGVIACLPVAAKRNKWYGTLFPIAGLALIFMSYFFAAKSISHFAVLPVCGAAFIIYFSSAKDFAGKLLSSPPFVHIGKLSYSLYLWHWPVIVLFRNLAFKFSGTPTFLVYLYIIAITYLLSLVSFKLVETRLRYHPKTPKIVLAGLAFCVLLITFYKVSNFNVHYKSLYYRPTFYSRYYDVTPNQQPASKDDPLAYGIIIPDRPAAYNDAYKKEGIVNMVNDSIPKVLILGDSHGVMWAKTLLEATGELQLSSSVYTTDASRPFFNLKDLDKQNGNAYFTKSERVEFAKSVVRNIDKWKVKALVLSCRWETFTDNDKVNFENMIVYAKERGIKVMVINQPPQITFLEDCNAVQFISYLKIAPKKGFNTVFLSQEGIIKSNKSLEVLSQKHANVIVFDVFKRLYNKGYAKITHNKDVLYYDDDHLSYRCTQLFKEDLKAFIKGGID